MGLQGEYYKTFTAELYPILCKLHNYVLYAGVPHESWAEAIITVLPKEGKTPLQFSSYFPITLLCVDYKILTPILVSKMQRHTKK